MQVADHEEEPPRRATIQSLASTTVAYMRLEKRHRRLWLVVSVLVVVIWLLAAWVVILQGRLNAIG